MTATEVGMVNLHDSALTLADPRDEVRGSVLLHVVQELQPIDHRVEIDQAVNAVAEQGSATDLVDLLRSSDRLIGSRRLGRGDPVAVGLVAVAPLCRDEFLHPVLVRRRPDGLLTSGQVLLLRECVDAAISEDRQTRWAVQKDHRVEQEQVLDTLVMLS